MTAHNGNGQIQPLGELNARDDALRRAVRLTVVQELADEMAHDLNNVLTVIAGSLQLFLIQQSVETAGDIYIRHAIAAAQRGARMTDNLLAYASPQVVDLQELDLIEVVAAVAPLLHRTLGSAQALEFVRPAAPVRAHRVVADRRFIESALLALGSIMAARSDDAAHMTLRLDYLSADDAARQSGAVAADRTIVELRVECWARGLTSDDIRKALTPAFGAAPADRPTLDLSAAYASIRQCDGDIGVTGLEGTERSGCVVSILLPAVQPATF